MRIPILAIAALAAPFPAMASPVPYLDDPMVFPPEVFEGDPVESGEVRVQVGDGTGALVLEHTSYFAEIHAGLARVTLTQFFHNPYDEPLEATYLFPLPSQAAVDRMDLTCGDRLIEGFVVEKAEARALYEEAREEGRKAALLEQVRENLFRQHIAGLCPNEEVQITLEYVEQVGYADGVYTLDVPMTVGPRYEPPWVHDPGLETPYVHSQDPENARMVDITVILDEGMPVADLWSDTHDIAVEDEGAWGAQLALADDVALPDRDFTLNWTLAGEQPRAAVLAYRSDLSEPGYVALTIEPPILGDAFVSRPRELIFVVDSSGSMDGKPYETARAAVLASLEEMGPKDTFNLVRFSNDASSLFDFPQASNPTTREQARAWLDIFEGGGTQMDRGIVRSLDMTGNPGAMRLVLMLTDGYVDGEDLFALVKAHLGRSRLFSLGVGASPNRFILEGLAEMGRGDVIYAAMDAPVRDAVNRFQDRIAHPAMTDIQVDWGDLIVSETFPNRIPDLWAGQPVRVVGRYEIDPEYDDVDEDGILHTTVTVSGVVGTQVYQEEIPLDVPAIERQHEALSSLWARRKIRDLEWYPGSRTARQIKDAIIDVALEHHLVSTYTSLVALDDHPSACGPSSLQVAVPQEAPTGMKMMGTGGGGGGYGYGMGMLGTMGRGYGAAHFAAKAAGSAGIDGGSPIILGALDRSLIEAVIRRNLNAIRYCYERELRQDPNLAGKVVIHFVIGSDGSVSLAEVKESTVGNANVEQCVAGRFLRMQFPQPVGQGIVSVNYPMVFEVEP